jgi:DNA-binding MarR family transcriptional regulator
MQETSHTTTDEFVNAVLLASRVLVAVAARSLGAAPTGITLPQYRVLVVLAVHTEMNASALASELGTLPSSVTRLCDRLASKGLITRRPSSASRREVEIEITAAGLEVLERVTAVRRREIHKIIAVVPPQRQRSTVATLSELAVAAGDVPEQDWSLGWG